MTDNGAREDYPPISAYAAVGDCHTAALISDRGSVDWYCPVRFDAPAVFCRLLDARRGGFLSVAPWQTDFSATRRYVGDTNVLETTFHTSTGRVSLTDFMPVRPRAFRTGGADVEPTHQLLRRVEALDGDAEVEVRFKPTFDYGLTAAELRLIPGLGVVARRAPGTPDPRAYTWTVEANCHGDGEWPSQDAAAWLALGVPEVELALDAGEARGALRLRGGESRWIGLRAGGPDHDPLRLLNSATEQAEQRLHATLDYWAGWAARCTYNGPYRGQVVRSALALKLLTYGPSGAVVAAPTTSLPERIGGGRNWDYRFCWLRDSSLSVYSLMTVGYESEAAEVLQWLRRAIGPHVDSVPCILYTIDALEGGDERIIHGLEGYRGSRPVRVGNAAAAQRQLDIYGDVLNAAELHYRPHEPGRGNGAAGRAAGPTAASWALLRGLVEQAAERWEQPDSGMWEVRGEPRHFISSKLMCWAALDRGIRLAEAFGLDAPLERWHAVRLAIRAAILERGYNHAVGAFTQAIDSDVLDASVLQIPRIGFLPATDPRVLSTLNRLQRDLMQDGLLRRYQVSEADDGLGEDEGAFTLCSLWLVDALALAGRLDEARTLFERVLGCANDLGLLSEEIEPRTRALLGNFPQGFSHLSVIRSAVNLAAAAQHGAEHEALTEAERAEPARQAAQDGHDSRAARRR